MQTRNEVTENVPPPIAASHQPLAAPKSFPAVMRVVAPLAAWLVPGLGHLTLRRYARALIFFLVIGGSFAFGLLLNGRLFWPLQAEGALIGQIDPITLLWTFCQLGGGLLYFGSMTVGMGTIPNPAAATFEYGNAFMFLAGLLNYLVAHDAYDVAVGRKQ